MSATAFADAVGMQANDILCQKILTYIFQYDKHMWK